MVAAESLVPCFTLRRVCKTYTSAAGQQVAALRSFSVELPWGARVGILGHSGAGKSTLLQLLGLLDDPDPSQDPEVDLLFHDAAGPLSYFNRTGPVCKPLTAADRDRLKNQVFGFVFQSGHLLRHLSALENVSLKLMLDGLPRKEREEVARELLTSLELGKRADHRAYQLSGGEAQRSAVLRALASTPRVVFADEPTGNLDRVNAEAVLNRLCRWQSEGTTEQPRTLLLVTHQTEDAWNHCTHFLIMQRDERLPPIWRTHKEVEDAGGYPALIELLREKTPPGDAAPSSTTSEAPATPPAEKPAPAAMPAPAETSKPATKPKAPGRLRLRDYFGLAWGDLTRQEHRWTTFANALVLFFLLLLSLIGLALMVGMNQLVQDRLERLEATSFVVDGLGSVDGYLTDQVARDLATLQLKDYRLAFPPDLGGVQRFNVPSRQFYKYKDETTHGELADRPVRGRTALPSDPDLLALLPQGFSSIQAYEIIVTPRFLTDELKAPLSAQSVWIETGDAPRKLTIRKVVDRLRDGAAYMLPDGFLQLLQSGKLNADRLANGIALAGIADPITLRARILADEDLVKRLDSQNLIVEAETNGLVFRLKDGQAQIREHLETVGNFWRRILSQRNMGTTPWITINQTTVKHLPRPVIELGPATFSKATLRVRHTDDLKEVDYLLRKMNMSVPDEVMSVLKLLTNTIQPLNTMILTIVSAALAVGLINLIVTMLQMVREKRGEMGILKAHGMTTWQLGAMFALEGFLLLSVATGLAWLTGFWLSSHLNNAPLQEDWPALIHFGSLTVTLTALIAVAVGPIVCVATTYWQARQTSRELMS